MARLDDAQKACLIEWLDYAEGQYQRQRPSRNALDLQILRRLRGDLRGGADLVIGSSTVAAKLADVGHIASKAWSSSGEWLTIEEGSDGYGVPARTLRRWAAKGSGGGGIRSRWVGPIRQVHGLDIEKKISERRTA